MTVYCSNVTLYSMSHVNCLASESEPKYTNVYWRMLISLDIWIINWWLISSVNQRFPFIIIIVKVTSMMSHLISSDGKRGNNPLVYLFIFIHDIILIRVRRVRWAAICKRENVEDVRVTLHWRQHSARSWLCSKQPGTWLRGSGPAGLRSSLT